MFMLEKTYFVLITAANAFWLRFDNLPPSTLAKSSSSDSDDSSSEEVG